MSAPLTQESLEAGLHAYARELVATHKARGHRIDKKQLRFNDIVAVGSFYARCGFDPLNLDAARAGVREAVEACISHFRQSPEPAPVSTFRGVRVLRPNMAMHIPGGSVLTMIQPWMVSQWAPTPLARPCRRWPPLSPSKPAGSRRAMRPPASNPAAPSSIPCAALLGSSSYYLASRFSPLATGFFGPEKPSAE